MLLGTQMVAKGHHFAGVELAAVIDADTGLAMPDFRAEERTFQLVTQLAGRSGRDAPGRVIVQTFQPDSRAVAHAARHDVERFLAEELERREALGYPPYAHLVRIVVTGPEREPVLRALEELKAGVQGAELLGPAPLLRLRGKHRAQLVAKTEHPARLASQAARLLAAAAPAMRRARLTAVVDVDPQSLSDAAPWGVKKGAAAGRPDRRVGDPRRDASVAARARARSRPTSTSTRSSASRSAAGSGTSSPSPTRTSPRSAGRCRTCAGCARSSDETERAPRGARRRLRGAPRRPGRVAARRRALGLRRR